ncbi:MAG: PilT/PilU family type 4a pilus ATPase [Oxalobacteraceae bacterium]|nr:PilT/PilU family type 4a pilus ATPase [Oxalobacteraceae bacterium]
MNTNQAWQSVQQLLTVMRQRGGSDMFITAGFSPAIKLDGKMDQISQQVISPEMSRALVLSTMNERQREEFLRTNECNFAISIESIGRFRVSAFVQQGKTGMVVRTITTEIPDIDTLSVPAQLKEIVMHKRGLIIMVGGTGSGKSTTLAAMIGHRNSHSHGHIITIEDPIEFVHPHRNCIVTQREVGTDTADWHTALKNTLRQAPDVILIGEIRDRETMDHAIAFAETGHLCLATLHANNSNQALDRIINFFPEERRAQLLMDLSLNLRALISQRLVPLKAGPGRCAAVEIMLNSPLISDLICKGHIHEIKEIMKKSRELGMQTFDQALFDLIQADRISIDQALRHADSMNDLRLAIKLHGHHAGASKTNQGSLEIL